MTASPEWVTTSEVPPAVERPAFMIDEDTPPEIAQQLRLDELWLLRHPLLREAALTNVDESSLRQDSIWTRLTDPAYVRYFDFDYQTERKIRDDPRMESLKAQESGKNSEGAAQDLAFRRRKLRLEIFLERAKEARTLGATALNAKE